MVKRSSAIENESDNFVRRNLKRRFKGYRKKPGTKPRRSLEDVGQDSSDDASGSSGDEDAKQMQSSSLSAKSEVGAGGCMESSWGLDPLLLSLDAYQHFSATGEVSVMPCTPNGFLDAADQRMLDEAEQQCNKPGIVMETADYRNKKTSTGFNGGSDGLNFSCGLGRHKSEINKDMYERLAPKCPGHSLPMKLLVVKKDGRNKGRKFYGCCYPSDQRCKAFMWAEENPLIVAQLVRESLRDKQKDDLSLSKLSEQLRFAFDAYRRKLEGMVTEELKAEIRFINARLALCQTDAHAASLKIGGRREELVERLLSEALRTLSGSMLNYPNGDSYSSSMNSKAPAPSLRSANTMITLDDDDEDDDDDDDDDDEFEFLPDPSTIVAAKKSSSSSSSSSSSLGRLPPPDEALRTIFGFTTFLPGQRWAIDRCLCNSFQAGMGTVGSLLIMATGAGKSLCYMLPSACVSGLTIVVSPLIALMQDQMKKLPVQLPAACFSGLGASSNVELGKLTAAVVKGFVKVLFVSPERLCTEAFRSLIRTLKREARSKENSSDPISLLCLDEAHCLSSWSFNFRPSFLRIRKELRGINPRAVLALTATATPSVQRDICAHLGIRNESDVLRLSSRRENLTYTANMVDCEDKKREEILRLLTSMRDVGDDKEGTEHEDRVKRTKRALPATIVYVWRRDHATSLAEYLHGSGISAMAYHAGMSADQRMHVQDAFFRGTADVIVATVAFGMGVDKSDIRLVVHSSMPKSLESFIQETGRAGRDCEPARCHMIFSPEDLCRQASLMNSSKLSLVQVYALLSKVFRNAQIGAKERCARGLGHISDSDFVVEMLTAGKCLRLQRQVYVPLAELEALDVPDAVAETVLAILELPPFGIIQVDPRVRNLVSGRLRFQPVFLARQSAESRTQLDMTGMQFKRLDARSTETLQTLYDLAIASAYSLSLPASKAPQLPTSKVVSRSWYETGDYSDDDDDRYGSGADDQDDILEARRKKAAATSSYDPCRFEILLSDLCLALHRSRDEVTLSLYILQKNALIEYNLGLPSLEVCLLGQSSSSAVKEVGRVEGDTVEDNCGEIIDDRTYSFVYELSNRVLDTMEAMGASELRRLLEMWRAARAISEATSETQPSVQCQAEIRDMLSNYIERDTEIVDFEQITSVSTPVPLSSSSVSFRQCICSQESTGFSFQEPTSDDLERLRQDILLLARDPRLSIVIKSILSRAKLSDNLEEGLRTDAILRLRALYISRVLHGLGSALLPLSQGRDFFCSWGLYSIKFLFGFIVNFTYNTIRLLLSASSGRQ